LRKCWPASRVIGSNFGAGSVVDACKLGIGQEETMSTKRFNVATFNTLNLVLPGITFYCNK
jgi:hypothetical protein